MPITTAVILLLAILVAPILLIRFRKRWVAAFKLAITNRITSRFAARLPGFGVLTYVGRKSGRVYRTPVNVFRAPEGFLIALTYGRESLRTARCADFSYANPTQCGSLPDEGDLVSGREDREEGGDRAAGGDV